ncbi:RES family NAD+ phosphorylase [Roseivivax marinus]|uniref:RES family NAD+ phosphorylase n=1 Tax=Roseivivax marinus TaxID=1379903 RepID=UPI0011138B63|nr:RES family NAD+ phosphorylase [Roseivivax marinus]
MHLDPAVISDLTRSVRPERWVRVMPARHKTTQLGAGFGSSRWSSPTDAFKVIYIGQEIDASISETVIRDRFEALPPTDRKLNLSEITSWAITEIRCQETLKILDLTGSGAFRLGLNTDAVGARAHEAGQAFSEVLHADFPDLDGIMYPSRLTRGRCIAVYDRSIKRCLEADPAIGLERVPSLGMILSDLSITLIDDLS